MEICHSASQAKWVHALGLAMKMACCLEFSCLEIMEISRKQLEIAPYCSILLIKGTRLARFQPNIWLQLVIHIVVGLRQLFWNEFEGKTYGTPGVFTCFCHQLWDEENPSFAPLHSPSNAPWRTCSGSEGPPKGSCKSILQVVSTLQLIKKAIGDHHPSWNGTGTWNHQHFSGTGSLVWESSASFANGLELFVLQSSSCGGSNS